MRRIGKIAPLFLMAARTRSFASFTAASGSPTMLNAGSPWPISTSTSTSAPSSPTTAQLHAFASIPRPPSPVIRRSRHRGSSYDAAAARRSALIIRHRAAMSIGLHSSLEVHGLPAPQHHHVLGHQPVRGERVRRHRKALPAVIEVLAELARHVTGVDLQVCV